MTLLRPARAARARVFHVVARGAHNTQVAFLHLARATLPLSSLAHCPCRPYTCSPSSSPRRTRVAHASLAKSTRPWRPCRRPSSQRRTRGPHVPRAPCTRPSEPRTATPQCPNHTTTTLTRQPHHHPLNRKSPPKNLVTPGRRGWSLVQQYSRETIYTCVAPKMYNCSQPETFLHLRSSQGIHLPPWLARARTAHNPAPPDRAPSIHSAPYTYSGPTIIRVRLSARPY